MTSYFSGSERQDHVRRRPTSSHPRARPAKAFFGDEPQRSVSTPCIAVAYNHEMNAVDRGDQLRSYIGYNHAIRRGGWQALAWTFLLETALINTYILQKRGSCNWKSYENQEQWREAICSQLIAKYHHDGVARKYLRAGDEFTQVSQHNHVKTGKYSPCRACRGDQVGMPSSRRPRRPALSEVNGNMQKRPRQTNYRCDKCDVAICTAPNCWYFYHQPISI